MYQNKEIPIVPPRIEQHVYFRDKRNPWMVHTYRVGGNPDLIGMVEDMVSAIGYENFDVTLETRIIQELEVV